MPEPRPPSHTRRELKEMERELLSYHRKINRRIGRAIADYGLIRENDRILVAISGGKDSLLLLYFLSLFRKKSPVPYELFALHVDQGGSQVGASLLRSLFEEWGVPLQIESQGIQEILGKKLKEGDTYCSLCSRLRRGVLNRLAREMGCNKIALGHHRDDFIETFLLNAFYSGKLGSMTPIYRVGEGDLKIIRPLYSVPEEWIRRYVGIQGWPVVTCDACPAQKDGLKRNDMKELLGTLEASHPGIKDSLMASLGNLHTEELMDRSLWSHPGYAIPSGELLKGELAGGDGRE